MESKSGENFLSLQCKDKGEGGGLKILLVKIAIRPLLRSRMGFYGFMFILFLRLSMGKVSPGKSVLMADALYTTFFCVVQYGEGP